MKKTLDISGSLSALGTFGNYLWPKKNRRLKARILLTLFFLLLAKIINIFVPIFYKKAIDTLNFSSQFLDSKDHLSSLLNLPFIFIFAYGGARISSQLFNELKDVLFVRVEQHAIRTVTLKVFHHLHHLGLRFHLDRKTGGLSRIIEKGISSIETVMKFMIFNILPTFLEIILVAVILWNLYDYRVVLITFVTLFFYVLVTLLITEWRTPYARHMNASSIEANSKAIDSLINYETVKYFNNEQHEIARYNSSLEDYEKAAIKTKFSLSCLNLAQGFIISIGLVSIMGLAAFGVVQKTLTLGDFVLMNSYLLQLYLPLNILGFAYREIKISLINMEEMFKLLNISPEIKDDLNALPLNLKQGEIEFDQVNFSYHANREILKNISFKIPAGKTLAIVGSSGSGKSTIARLVFRFYEPTQGNILIDHQNIQHLTQHSVRSKIGMVPQDTVLFNESLYYNIAYGRLEATENEIVQATKLAEIYPFIESLPDKFQTMVGERGLKLSGGEKQRIALARTFLKNPSIFIFDEATSALDTKTEKRIQKKLREISKGRTTLIIAHRLSTIVDADEILVLEKGEIKERGTHLQLLNFEGLYTQMWQQQLETEETY